MCCMFLYAAGRRCLIPSRPMPLLKTSMRPWKVWRSPLFRRPIPPPRLSLSLYAPFKLDEARFRRRPSLIRAPTALVFPAPSLAPQLFPTPLSSSSHPQPSSPRPAHLRRSAPAVPTKRRHRVSARPRLPPYRPARGQEGRSQPPGLLWRHEETSSHAIEAGLPSVRRDFATSQRAARPKRVRARFGEHRKGLSAGRARLR
jgi:hypothetical protein